MRARTLAALMAGSPAFLAGCGAGSARHHRGTVKDASGAALPGATVEAKTYRSRAERDVRCVGGFRFPSVSPGVYEVTATLASFAPQKFADVTVGLGQIKRLEFALGLAGVAESVSVTADARSST